MTLDAVLSNGQRGWLNFKKGQWEITEFPDKNEKERKRALIQLFCELSAENEGKLRALWSHLLTKEQEYLPGIIQNDGFLTALVKGYPVHTDFVHKLIKGLETCKEQKPPLIVETQKIPLYHRVMPTPNGLLAKLSVKARRIADDLQIEHSIENFARLAFEKRVWLRKWQTYATLAYGSAYRELNRRELWLPDFECVGKLIHYRCEEDLISEGIKTILLFPEEGSGGRGIYLIQGTNPYPSQPHTLNSFLENFGKGGSGRAAYEHSWRRIHKHLRALVQAGEGKLVTIVGHSLGGSLGIQIYLYSQAFIHESFAFNPPMPQESDLAYFNTLPDGSKKQLNIFINGDDFASWRLGACLFGNVYLVLGVEPWHAMNIHKRDMLLLFPYLYKLVKNFPLTILSHITTYLLDTHFVVVPLTQQEIDLENKERRLRPDHMRFLPTMHTSLRGFFRRMRRYFSRSSEKRVLKNEIELLTLLEEELKENPSFDTQKKLEEIHKKREELKVQLIRLEMQRKI